MKLENLSSNLFRVYQPDSYGLFDFGEQEYNLNELYSSEPDYDPEHPIELDTAKCLEAIGKCWLEHFNQSAGEKGLQENLWCALLSLRKRGLLKVLWTKGSWKRGLWRGLGKALWRVLRRVGPAFKTTYTRMSSPREYNFATDAVHFDLEIDDFIIQLLYESCKADPAFPKYIQDYHASRDGFSSWMPESLPAFIDAYEGRDGEDSYQRSIWQILDYSIWSTDEEAESFNQSFMDDAYEAMNEVPTL